MNPIITLTNAIKHLQHAGRGDKTQARLDAMRLLSEAYKRIVHQHEQERAYEKGS